MAGKNSIEERPVEETGIPSKDEVISNEYDLLESLFAAAEYKEDEDLRKEIHVTRNGRFLFKFTVRPLSEEDLRTARKKATTYMKNPAGKNLPPIEKEVSFPEFKSWKIYLATIDEDKAKIWDNPQIKSRYGLKLGSEVVEKLLLGGEKDAFCEVIDDISGYNLDMSEYSKN